MTTVTNKTQGDNGVIWFDVHGVDLGTGWDFDGEESFGITADYRVLDCDGSPLTAGDLQEVAVKNALNS